MCCSNRAQEAQSKLSPLIWVFSVWSGFDFMVGRVHTAGSQACGCVMPRRLFGCPCRLLLSDPSSAVRLLGPPGGCALCCCVLGNGSLSSSASPTSRLHPAMAPQPLGAATGVSLPQHECAEQKGGFGKRGAGCCGGNAAEGWTCVCLKLLWVTL